MRPFPNVEADRELISTAGGDDPVWSWDTGELFFRSGETILSVTVTDGPPSEWGNPERLFDSGGKYNFLNPSRNFDIAPDGRFLMATSGGAARDRDACCPSSGSRYATPGTGSPAAVLTFTGSVGAGGISVPGRSLLCPCPFLPGSG